MEEGSFWEVTLKYFMLGVFPWIFVALGAWLMWSAHKFMRKALRATGTVVAVHEKTSYSSSSNRRTTTYQPIFEYTLPDGRTVQGKTFLSASGRNWPVGTEKEILVDPDNPETVRIPGFLIYGFGGIFFVMGSLFGIAALFALRSM